jgi:hypothetical protein
VSNLITPSALNCLLGPDLQVQEVDEPDLALRLAEGLRERPEAAITTQVGQSVAC